MGCSESRQCTVFLCWEGIAMGKKNYRSRSITSSGDYDVDLSSFSPPRRVLGIGGFGMVRAVTKITGVDKNTAYALKSLSKGAVLQRSSGIAAVLSELKALALLVDAKFICNVHYAFQDAIFLYMIIDLAAGGDLRFALKFSPNCRFNEVRARFYVAQIIQAIDSCHAASILHRDIKPENILLQANGYLLLSDFGVAKILQDVEDCRSTSGTHGYMAPEIYLPQHRHGTAADWFALGVTLHEFVTGRRPFETSKLQAFRNGEANAGLLSLVFLESCNYISESCKDFIAGLLVSKPSRRLGSYRGMEEMKQHSWLGGFDWEKLVAQSLPAPYKPDVSFDRTDVKGENMRKAVYDHINSKSISAADQHHFQSYEYRRRYYTCGEYDTSYNQTKATVSFNTSSVVSNGTGHNPITPVIAPAMPTNGHISRHSQKPASSIKSPTSTFAKPQGDKRIRAHCRQNVTYGENASENVNPDNTRSQPRADMVWTLKSELASERASKIRDSNSNYQNARHQEQSRPMGCSQKDNGRSHDFGGLGFMSSKSRDHNWVQVSRNDEGSGSAAESKSSNVEMASAVATGSTVSGSAASIKFMASHMRAPGSKNYIQKSPKDLKLQAKESSQSDGSAKQTYSTATRAILTISSKIVNSNPISFKPQKDKRQKLDGVPVSMESDVPVIAQHPSSCLIYQKSNIIESLYATHQQQNILRPPVVIVNKALDKSKDIAGEEDDNSSHANIFRLENAIASASVGVRVFHGLNQIPNLSEEEGQAADWVGHVMSSASALIEVSVENSKKHDEMSPDSAGVSLESECPRSKWGGGPLDNPEVMLSAPGVSTETLVRPYDCSTSYRDQVMNIQSRSRPRSIPSVQITTLAAARSRPTSLIKSSFADWQVADQRRPGSQRLSGKYDGIVARGDWNTENSQDGDNASVSIVSPDATDNKELALDAI